MRPAKKSSAVTSLILAVALAGCANGRPEAKTAVYDPIEPLNRKIFAVNQVVDRRVLQPVARSYTRVVPQPARRNVRNFVTNLSEPGVFVNDVLQLNLTRAAITVGRFGMNTTLGLAGLFDVAAHTGLRHHDADLGQTFGRWGVPPGPHLELPLLGSASFRDTVGKGLGGLIDPLTFISGGTVATVRAAGGGAGLVDGRARLLPLTDKLKAESSDYYATLRNVSAAHRADLVQEARSGVERGPADSAPPVAVPDIAPAGVQ